MCLMYVYTYIHTYTHTYKHAYTHAHTHTNTQIHIHYYFYVILIYADLVCIELDQLHYSSPERAKSI